MLRSFVCALVSVVTLQIFDPYRGKRVLYQASYSRDWYFFEIIFFILLGVVGVAMINKGLIGVLLTKLNFAFRDYAVNIRIARERPLYHILILSGVTVIATYFSLFTRIDGSELLESLFKECTNDEHLGLCSSSNQIQLILTLFGALFCKMILLVITANSLVPGGIYFPAMICGGLAGRIIGEFSQWLNINHLDWALFTECPRDSICITPGMYSLLGAMATFTGVTKLTVSLTVIMFELTGTVNYIVPCMITLMTSKAVTNYFKCLDYTLAMIKRKGYPYLEPREEILMDFKVKEKMTKITTIKCFYETGMKKSEIEEILRSTNVQNFPIITNYYDHGFIGVISRIDLLRKLAHSKHKDSEIRVFFNKEACDDYISAAKVVDNTPLSVDPDDTMEYVVDLFKKMGPQYIVVMKMGKLQGLITKKDLLLVIC